MFKVPGDDEETYDRETSTSAPLLGGEATGSRMEELEALERSEGPQEGVKGTLMDGIANVSSAVLASDQSLIADGQLDHGCRHCWVSQRKPMRSVCQADDRLPYAVSQAGFVTGVGLLIALAALTDWRAMSAGIR